MQFKSPRLALAQTTYSPQGAKFQCLRAFFTGTVLPARVAVQFLALLVLAALPAVAQGGGESDPCAENYTDECMTVTAENPSDVEYLQQWGLLGQEGLPSGGGWEPAGGTWGGTPYTPPSRDVIEGTPRGMAQDVYCTGVVALDGPAFVAGLISTIDESKSLRRLPRRLRRGIEVAAGAVEVAVRGCE